MTDKHYSFRPQTFEQGVDSVTGDCNGYSKEYRFQYETPLFAAAILRQLKPGQVTILDYGCGVGRLAKEILKQNSLVTVIGVDVSDEELKLAREYVNDNRFIAMKPWELDQKVDLVYCVYVLQHIPSIDVREALMRMHGQLKDDGTFVFCSSLYRMALCPEGFWDDRSKNHVDLPAEIGRFFRAASVERSDANELFTREEFEKQEILRVMVKGEGGKLAHPAWVMEKRQLSGPCYNARPFNSGAPQAPAAKLPVETPGPAATPAKSPETGQKRLILRNRLSPGDILVMSVAIRALQKAHPGRFLVDVDTPCSDIFRNNPYVTSLGGDGQVIDMHYPEIHKSGASGRHFTEGHRKFLEEALGLTIPRDGLLPDIFLDQNELLWPSPVVEDTGDETRYWCINAGSKNDYPLKQYHRWQEVVDKLNAEWKGRIRLVQIGQKEHNHPSLDGVIDYRGKTDDVRKLFRLIHKAEGVITSISFPMHIAAALKKPAVVVAGGREGTRWELYPHHRFLNTNGALPCCSYDGCWKNKINDCIRPVDVAVGGNETKKVPLCMEITAPHTIADAVQMYYKGGILEDADLIFQN